MTSIDRNGIRQEAAFTSTMAPVMKSGVSEARSVTVRATSSGAATRPPRSIICRAAQKVRDGVGLEDARIVDKDIDPSHLANDALDEVPRRVRVGHVSAEERVRPPVQGS